MTAAQQWIGLILTAATLCVVVWFEWGQHQVRTWLMKRGIDVHLTLAPEKGRESWGYELHVPPNTEIPIQIRLEPRFGYHQQSIIFGFEGNRSEKPEPLSVLNTFIARGKRRAQSPETNENHTVDYNGSYHIRDERVVAKPSVYAYGFIVRTRKPGRYPVVVIVLTDCGEAVPKTDLFLIVEERGVKPATLQIRQPRRSSSKAAS